MSFDPEKFIDLIFGDKRKRAEKLCDLTAEEQAAWAEIDARAHALQKENDRIVLQARQLQIDREKWWMKVKDAHKLPDGITFHDGGVYKLREPSAE